MKKLIVFGNSLLAKLTLFYFQRDKPYEIVGLTTDKKFISCNEFCGLKVFPFETIEETHPPSEYDMFIAIGPSKMNQLREQKFNEAKDKGYTLATYISRHAICDSPLGENCFVSDMALIHPFVSIGNNNFFWEKVFIADDSCIQDHCYFSPTSATGTFSKICSNSILGTGSIVKTGIKISQNTLIGASCYISKNTKLNGVYAQRNAEFLGQCSGKIDISI